MPRAMLPSKRRLAIMDKRKAARTVERGTDNANASHRLQGSDRSDSETFLVAKVPGT
jgi:hypothetical protein